MLPTSRRKALADTLDRLEALADDASVRLRIARHSGARFEAELRSATRRGITVLDADGIVHVPADDIAEIRVGERSRLLPWRRRWRTWFAFGEP